MNIFISWSGNISMQIAEKLKGFIPKVIQSARPYYSPDMDKGIKWEAELNQKLSECLVGLICLTKDNTDKPWILFEAGALSNRFESSKVCCIAFGLKKSEITRPLSIFQLTEFERSDFFKLMQSINRSLDSQSIDENILKDSFDAFYDKFEVEVKEILKSGEEHVADIKPQRTERDILEEILDLVRKNSTDNIAIDFIPPAPDMYLKKAKKLNVLGPRTPANFFEVGDKIFHESFGIGEIIAISNVGSEKKFDVRFNSLGKSVSVTLQSDSFVKFYD